jgi:hypothetical protein
MMAMRVMMRMVMKLTGENFHCFLYSKHIEKDFASRRADGLHFFQTLGTIPEMVENNENVLAEYGQRVQRCYGCFVSYYLKDMYLGEDVTFFCEHCHDETMFHFSSFSKMLDISKLREVAEEEHHH